MRKLKLRYRLVVMVDSIPMKIAQISYLVFIINPTV